MEWYWGLVIGLACLVVGILVGVILRRKIAEAKIGSAERQAVEILENAMRQAETRKKEALLEAKDEIFRQRSETEADLKERRREVAHQERRIQQKEEAIDRKVEALERKEEALAERQRELDALKEQISQQLEIQMAALEKIAGMSAEEAKAELLAQNTLNAVIEANQAETKQDMQNAKPKRRFLPDVKLPEVPEGVKKNVHKIVPVAAICTAIVAAAAISTAQKNAAAAKRATATRKEFFKWLG